MSAPKKRTSGDVLRESRQRDSREKRSKVLAVVDDMKAKGDPISMLAVARAAGVSNWLVYQPQIKEYIEAARASQAKTEAKRKTSGTRASAASLAVDLELARAEIKDLREERDRLKAAVQRNLGQQLDQAHGDLATAAEIRKQMMRDQNRDTR
ncbi:DUF6262 family protein [Kitasatospora sp. NPDC001574]